MVSRLLLLFMTVSIVSLSCKTTEETIDKIEEIEDRAIEKKKEKTPSGDDLLDEYRNELSDVYASQNHDYPEVFKHIEKKEKENEVDYRGFRIQLISTRNVSLADSTEARFQTWLNKHPTTYQPNAYTLFRQPYYRVHIGDFQVRERAIRYSRLLKKKFPAAWVVHDRINPNRVPADSIDMAFAVDSLAMKHDTTTAPSDTISINLDES